MFNLLALLAAASSIGLSPIGAPRPDGPLQVGFTNTTQNDPAVLPPSYAPALEGAIAPGGVVRFSIQWRLVQPQPGAPIDLDAVDRNLVQPALAAGLRPLIVVTAAPQWAWGGAECDQSIERTRGFCIMPPGDDPADLARWASFVQAVAQRFGHEVAGIEVWNEENGAGFWNTTDGPDPGAYADVLCSAYDAVQQASPGTPVILGGLAASPTDSGHLGAGDFLNALYADANHDVKGCMTAIGVHPYPLQRAPNTIGSPFLAKLAEVRAARDAHGDTGRPLWITEFGYWTGGPGAVTPDQQALGLSCAVRMAQAMPDVDAFVIHDLVDRGPPDTSEGSYGVYAAGNGQAVPKAAALTLRQLLASGAGAIPPAPPC